MYYWLLSLDRSYAEEWRLSLCWLLSLFFLESGVIPINWAGIFFLEEFGLILGYIIWKEKSPRDFICKRGTYLSMSSDVILIPVLTPGVAWQTEQNAGLKAIFHAYY